MTREERRSYWQHIVEEQALSGLEATVYCLEHNIKIPQFYRWRRKFQGMSDEASGSKFIQLMPSDNNPESGIRIRIFNDIFIEIDRGFDPATLRTAVKALSIRG